MWSPRFSSVKCCMSLESDSLETVHQLLLRSGSIIFLLSPTYCGYASCQFTLPPTNSIPPTFVRNFATK